MTRFEGRLLARRKPPELLSPGRRPETFTFFDEPAELRDSRPLETYLFSIAAHKLTDHLRREGRRPTLPLVPGPVGSSSFDPAGPARAASSIYRSSERRQIEEQALVEAIDGQLRHWRGRGDWRKIQCAELLFVRGWPNKQVAAALDISEQAVANTKFDFLARLRTAIRSQLLPRVCFRNSMRWNSRLCVNGSQAGAGQPGDVRAGFKIGGSRHNDGAPIRQADLRPISTKPCPPTRWPGGAGAQRRGTARQAQGDLFPPRLRRAHLGRIWRATGSAALRQRLATICSRPVGRREDYVVFHLETIGCRYCRASLNDLEKQQAEAHADVEQRRRKYFQSSAGLLKK